MRVLVFGDSIAEGFWDTHGGWVGRLRAYYDEQQLQDINGPSLPSVCNLGVSGDTSEDILQRIESETEARTWRGDLPVVVLQTGINDSSVDHGTIRVSPEYYRRNIADCIDRLRPLCTKIIVVGLSACDEAHTQPVAWGDYRFANQAISEYEVMLGQVAKAQAVPFIPIFDAFKRRLEAGEPLLTDGLHPNSAGHAVLFELIRPAMDEFLV